METGLAIKKYLDENGISQARVGRKAKIDLSKLNLALNRKRKLTLDEYARICYALGVNTDSFLKPRLPDAEEVG